MRAEWLIDIADSWIPWMIHMYWTKEFRVWFRTLLMTLVTFYCNNHLQQNVVESHKKTFYSNNLSFLVCNDIFYNIPSLRDTVIFLIFLPDLKGSFPHVLPSKLRFWDEFAQEVTCSEIAIRQVDNQDK